MIIQAGIMIFGASAIWVVGRKESWSRWGYILGLMGQPFWIAAALQSDQYGILIMTVFYTYAWGQGIWNHWLNPRKKKRGLPTFKNHPPPPPRPEKPTENPSTDTMNYTHCQHCGTKLQKPTLSCNYCLTGHAAKANALSKNQRPTPKN